MILTKLTASFGKLAQDTLELTPGLNVLAQPNEGGKSTWAAFLLAMFYGIDTTQRAKIGMLPDKTKFKPWGGQPMAGTMELVTDEGRRIRIERTSRGRVPMGEFSAYDMDTGLAIEDLTAENCGVTLLGVERSVFARSAFVQGTSLALSEDDALERRLSALVTTGDERASASSALKLLRDQKNKIQHNKTGLLPQALREQEQLTDTLSQLKETHRQAQALRAKEQELSLQKIELDRQAALLQAQELSEKRAALDAAKRDSLQAQSKLGAARAQTAKYPSEAQLTELGRALCALQEQADAPLPDAPEAPVCPPVFENVAPDAIMEKAQRDGREFDRLTAGKRRSPIPALLVAAIYLVTGIAMLILKNYIIVALCATAVVVLAAMFVYFRKKARIYDENMDKAQSLLAAYENHSRDEFALLAAQYRERLLVYAQQKAAYDAALSQQQAARQQRAEQQAKILGAASVFAPNVQTAQAAQRAIEAAEADYARLQACENALALAKSREEALQKAYGQLPDLPAPAIDAPVIDAAQLARTQALNEQQRALVRSQLDQNRGREAALADPAALHARLEALDGQIAALKERYAAIELAQKTLADADAALQTRFAPQIAAKAGEYFAALTQNRYDRVLLDRTLALSAGETGEAGLHETLALSTGTADQLYLAARLAICDLLLPQAAPLVLDDALLTFDDKRMRAAMALLSQIASRRQILLFSCHTRERDWLQTSQET